MATFWQRGKGSREAASEGPTALHIHFCSLLTFNFELLNNFDPFG